MDIRLDMGSVLLQDGDNPHSPRLSDYYGGEMGM